VSWIKTRKMAVLKNKDIEKLSGKERTEKIKELKMELIKSKASNKGNLKAKNIKIAMARLLTFNRTEELNKSSNKKKTIEKKK